MIDARCWCCSCFCSYLGGGAGGRDDVEAADPSDFLRRPANARLSLIPPAIAAVMPRAVVDGDGWAVWDLLRDWPIDREVLRVIRGGLRLGVGCRVPRSDPRDIGVDVLGYSALTRWNGEVMG